MEDCYDLVRVRDWNDRREMTPEQLIKHKKNLTRNHNKKQYIKRKCKNRIAEIEDLITDTYSDLDCETLAVLFEELDIVKSQLDNINITDS